MSKALYDVAERSAGQSTARSSSGHAAWSREEVAEAPAQLAQYRKDLDGKRAAIYTGGAFKAFSLVRSLRTLGMKTVVAGSQTGNREDYRATPRPVRRRHDLGR